MADGYGRRRLDGWDYSRPTAYFATFCAHGRRCVLGRVIEGPDGAEVELSALGRLCADEAAALPSRLPNVSLDGFAIMPNHVHALITLDGGVTLGWAIGVWKAKTTARAREAGSRQVLRTSSLSLPGCIDPRKTASAPVLFGRPRSCSAGIACQWG